MTHGSRFDARSARWTNVRRAACVVLLASAFAARAADAPASDLTDLSLEQLLNVPVYSASKFAQKAAEAPASITVLTQDDIRQFGWRTLADALRSVRGMYVYSDRDYEYVGVRGFARPQDYNSRVLLLVNGHRTNDTLFDQAFIGTDAVVDLDLVDRIEIVRGPGSSVHGGNAMFGVVNVVTRAASRIDGFEAGVRLSSYAAREARLSYGHSFANGTEVVASISGMDSAGPSLYFPEFDAPETNSGRTSGTDYDRNGRLFVQVARGGLTFTAAAARRNEGVPTGLDGSTFNDPRNSNSDYHAYVDVGYARDLSPRTQVSGHLYWADYTSLSPSTFGDPPVLNHDTAFATWWGVDLKLVRELGARHKLVAGLEAQDNRRQDQTSWDEDPYVLYADDRRDSHRVGLFVQDDIQLGAALKATLGARYDAVSGQSGETSPRAGVIWHPTEATIWRLMYGQSFRAPNVYEKYYVFPDTQIANPSLRLERMRTWEAAVEHYLGKETRVLATAYYYRVAGLIDQVVDEESGLLQYRNAGLATASGLELEAEHQWAGGARVRASLDLHRPPVADGVDLTNSPRAVAKLNLAAPLPWWSLRLGVEGQWLGPRDTDLGQVPGYGVANVTLSRPAGRRGWELSASVFNAFDRTYADPSAFDPAVPARDRITQDGRTFRVKAVLKF